MEQKWRDLLNVAAAEHATVDYGAEFKRMVDRPRKGEYEKQFKKGLGSRVNVAIAEAEEKELKTAPRARERSWEMQVFGDNRVHWFTPSMALQGFW